MARNRIIGGLLLGGLSNIGYFVSAAFAVRLAGAAIPPLVIGTMPVLLSVIGNFRDRTVQWRLLAVPLGLIAAGVVIVNFAVLRSAPPTEIGNVLLGIVSATIGLSIWIIYGLINAAIMRGPNPPDGLHWTGLQGIGAAIASLALTPLTSFDIIGAVPVDAFWRFIGWSLLLGVAGSWFATWCWVVASSRLSLALSAQLIVAETVFGLGYGFIYEARLPTAAEAIGAALQFMGVGVAITLFTRRGPRRARAA